MAAPYTESGFNMYDMLSVIQKGVRRGNYELAGWGAQQLRGAYRTVMWNRIYVISSEDCFGILTKELVALRQHDEKATDDQNIANAMALLCRATKSRDACYFSCNFILDNRKRIDIKASDEDVNEFSERVRMIGSKDIQYDQFGFGQISIFGQPETDRMVESGIKEFDYDGFRLNVALEHRDMDMIGWHMNQLRYDHRDYLWDVLRDYCANHSNGILCDEIEALRSADTKVNGKRAKEKKDEIFLSKAAMLICHAEDGLAGDIRSSKIICPTHTIDWKNTKVKPIWQCRLSNGVIPDYVFDCHTLKGRKMGKTDWDMTRDEQEALYPLANDYFSDASWIYTYEQDYRNGVMTDKDMEPIREFAKSHPANPVDPYPYV